MVTNLSRIYITLLGRWRLAPVALDAEVRRRRFELPLPPHLPLAVDQRRVLHVLLQLVPSLYLLPLRILRRLLLPFLLPLVQNLPALRVESRTFKGEAMYYFTTTRSCANVKHSLP